MGEGLKRAFAAAKATRKKPEKIKPSEVKTWSVPMTYEYRGTVTVKARTEDEAYRAAVGGDFENHDDGEELINWGVIGKPTLEE